MTPQQTTLHGRRLLPSATGPSPVWRRLLMAVCSGQRCVHCKSSCAMSGQAMQTDPRLCCLLQVGIVSGTVVAVLLAALVGICLLWRRAQRRRGGVSPAAANSRWSKSVYPSVQTPAQSGSDRPHACAPPVASAAAPAERHLDCPANRRCSATAAKHSKGAAMVWSSMAQAHAAPPCGCPTTDLPSTP